MKVFILLLRVFGYLWLGLGALVIIFSVIGLATSGGVSKLLQEEMSSGVMQEQIAAVAVQNRMDPAAAQKYVEHLADTGPMGILAWVIIVLFFLMYLTPGVAALGLAHVLKKQLKAGMTASAHSGPEVAPATEARVDKIPPAKAWERVIDDLLLQYRQVERRSQELPAVSLSPLFISSWNWLKGGLLFYADLLLIVPISVAVFVRNFFPGRWSYRSFSWPYVKYAALWLWRGEVPQMPFVMVRGLVTFLFHGHCESRFRLLRRQLLLAHDLSEKDRTRLIRRIDQVLEAWRGPKIVPLVFTYVLPAAAFLLQVFEGLRPDKLPPWAGTLTVFLMLYAIAFVVTAFIVKRGLMLGGERRSAYFPGGLESLGMYEKEQRLFESLGIKAREFPLDIPFCIAGLILGLFLTPASMGLYKSWGMEISESELQFQIFLGTVTYVGIGLLCLSRRFTLRRA